MFCLNNFILLAIARFEMIIILVLGFLFIALVVAALLKYIFKK